MPASSGVNFRLRIVVIAEILNAIVISLPVFHQSIKVGLPARRTSRLVMIMRSEIRFTFRRTTCDLYVD